MTAPARVSAGWKRSLNLGEPIDIRLELDDPAIETRVFLRHDGLSYLQPLGDWGSRSEIRFLPEAPGSYGLAIQWRTRDGSGWIDETFEVGGADTDPSPRLVTAEGDIRLWTPSAWESQLAASHEKSALALAAQNVRPRSVIYDIGANLGLYSILLSRIAGPGGHVYCLEANPVCLYFLQANLRLNRVPSFEILPGAVMGTGATTEFRINYRNLLVGIAGAVPYFGKPGHTINVSGEPLDDLIDRHRLRPPDFIKMDIEGAEVEAIKGMQATIGRYHPTILMELHGRAAARGTLEGGDWSGYSFQEAASGESFADASGLTDWFPDACLQVVARHG